jgi:diacylglycerol kinase family enzyme
VSSSVPALVILNPSAHGGKGMRRFDAVRPIVESSFDARIVILGPDGGWRSDVGAALADGVRTFVAAGGDGTAHALLNALADAARRPPLGALVMGAVGLGSSNDLHKPVSRRVAGVPLRLDIEHAAPRDIVRCIHVDAAGRHQALVLVSASFGVTASANARFSANTRLATCLRGLSTTAAIAWAATRTVAGWRNLPARIAIDDGPPEQVALSSLSVLKTEWLSGWLRFGHAIESDSGDFDLALAEGLGRARLLMDILALLQGRFDGRPGHRRRRARSLDVRFDGESPLELDGEVLAAREARFDMLPERILLCA